ncbi:MAG: S1 RNA-binding domain-containing protein, partial [Candidatus Aminicenantaceae bacterium]
MSELNNDLKNEDELSMQDYADLLDKYQFKASELAPGKLVKGKVIKVLPTHVLVDIGSKSEGVIPSEDFTDKREMESLKSGDAIEAILERRNQKEGYFILSKRRANAVMALNNLEKAYHNNNWIIGKVVDKIRNGFTVDVGLDTFLPDSHADIKMVKNPDQLLGKRFKFKVIKFDRESENAVLSRKLLLQDEREQRKKQVFSQLEKGKTFKGKIKSLTNFGA